MTRAGADSKPTRDLSHLRVHYARVLRTSQITPLMRRVTLGEMDVPSFESIGPEQFVYVFFPTGDRTQPPVPHSFTWEKARKLPPEQRPVGRYYTIRHHRPEVGEVDIDMVLHGDGPGATFAHEAHPGDVVSFWGPRICYEPPESPALLLLLADLTGLPATVNVLESLPASQVVRVFIEVPDASEEQALPTAAQADVTWLHRKGLEAGKSDVLIDALRGMELPTDGLYVYGAGEYRVMLTLRRYLQEECGLRPESLSLINYWRHADHDLEREA